MVHQHWGFLTLWPSCAGSNRASRCGRRLRRREVVAEALRSLEKKSAAKLTSCRCRSRSGALVARRSSLGNDRREQTRSRIRPSAPSAWSSPERFGSMARYPSEKCQQQRSPRSCPSVKCRSDRQVSMWVTRVVPSSNGALFRTPCGYLHLTSSSTSSTTSSALCTLRPQTIFIWPLSCALPWLELQPSEAVPTSSYCMSLRNPLTSLS